MPSSEQSNSHVAAADQKELVESKRDVETLQV